jgi:hypothetical protein
VKVEKYEQINIFYIKTLSIAEADHSPLPTAEAKNGGDIPPLPHTSSWHDA